MKQTTLVFGEIKDIPNSNWIISGIKLRLHDQFKEGCYFRRQIYVYPMQIQNYQPLIVSPAAKLYP